MCIELKKFSKIMINTLNIYLNRIMELAFVQLNFASQSLFEMWSFCCLFDGFYHVVVKTCLITISFHVDIKIILTVTTITHKIIINIVFISKLMSNQIINIIILICNHWFMFITNWWCIFRYLFHKIHTSLLAHHFLRVLFLSPR